MIQFKWKAFCVGPESPTPSARRSTPPGRRRGAKKAPKRPEQPRNRSRLGGFGVGLGRSGAGCSCVAGEPFGCSRGKCAAVVVVVVVVVVDRKIG